LQRPGPPIGDRTWCAECKACAATAAISGGRARDLARAPVGTVHASKRRIETMRIVVFGLAVSSSWGNGHATLWRALGRALGARGHEMVFFERDVPYYAAHRDGDWFPGITVQLYADLAELRREAQGALAAADVAIVTSFCPEGAAVCAMVLESPAPVRVFYDLDTPVTLAALATNQVVPYLPAEGLGAFDLVLSYTGGAALDALRERLGARRTAPLYGSVDPAVHRPVPARRDFLADLSYLGTYSADRQERLDALMLEPARRAPTRVFRIAGSLYPTDFAWPANTVHHRHLAAREHAGFFASSLFTLNVTRGPMSAMGYCPSGRLFEATACGAAVVTDAWTGLEQFFAPGEEIIVARGAEDVLAAFERSRAEIERLAQRGRERTMDCHTAAHRAIELEGLLEQADLEAPVAAAEGA
jgi:spore maturation protein CgeB